MISSTNQPKSKNELVTSVRNLPYNVKFEVVEVFSNKDKSKVSELFDKFIRRGNGYFSVMFVEGGK